MPTDDFHRATRPLFDRGEVDAVEWSVDMGFGAPPPEWLRAHLEAYGARARLYGHGVEMSPFTVDASPARAEWLDELERAAAGTPFAHFSEHFGFMTAQGFEGGTPLPLPLSRAALDLGEERWDELRQRVGRPIGIENLAFALGPEDVIAQPAFLRELCARTDGFLLFDAHNLYCHAENFPAAMDGADALTRAKRLSLLYPLERVREIHVAGGSFAHPGRPFRRDSHDRETPADVLELVRFVVERCPALEVVILERSDRTLFGAAEGAAFQAEFRALREVVRLAQGAREPPRRPASSPPWIADDRASRAQLERAMRGELSSADAPHTAKARLAADPALAPYAAWIASWDTSAVDVGKALAAEWSSEPAPPGAPSQLAIVQTELHRPARRRRVAIPRPGPDQVLLRVRASGICGTDVHIREGRFAVPLPLRMGHEPVGEVEAVGEAVRAVAVGDRVGVPWVQAGCGRCPACARGARWACVDPKTWIQNGGGHTELIVAEAAGCVALPSGVAWEHAAPMMCAGFTVMSGYRAARPRPGERVAVLGLGGLGHLGVQIARAMGHEVVALTGSPDKRDEAIALGASVVLDAREDPGAALEAAGGADVILATTSALEAVSSVPRGLRPGGRVVLIGLGPGAVAIDPMTLILARGSIVGALAAERGDLVDALDLVARGAIRPWVERYPIALAERAFARVRDGRVRFRAVLEP
ncbi:MAG: DUF692 family protein [Polyangiaceae bacterium]